MEQAIEITDQGGLQCDNPKCDYKEDTPHEEYPNCINKPCPKCGENLLTQEDYDAWVAILGAISLYNSIALPPSPEDVPILAEVHYHNKNLNIKIN